MRGLVSRLKSAYAAAFLAVALLSYAVVPSAVMQAAGDPMAAMPMCSMGDMASISHDASGKAGHAPAKAHEVCGFCAAAAHAPMLAACAPLKIPSVVAWLQPLPPSLIGPRGPPATSPRARGPPAPPLNA